MSGWDLLTQLFWLPFNIMQRVSRQFILLGRNVYGRLFSSKPAIKPPPPPPPSSQQPFPGPAGTSSTIRHSSPSPLLPLELNSNISNRDTTSQSVISTKLPSCVIDITTLEASTAPIMGDLERMQENRPSLPVQPEPCKYENSGSAAVDHNELTSVVVNVDAADASREITSATTDSVKRFRDREKRTRLTKQKSAKNETATSKAEQVAQSTSSVPSQSKKQKLSEEEQRSVSVASVGSSTSQDNTSSVSASTAKNRKKRTKKNSKEDQVTEEDGKMGRQPPPNFFIAVQIYNEDIISGVAQVQKALSEKKLTNPWHGLATTEIFKDAMVPLTKLHFTLHVMHLKGPEDIEKAQSAFTECCNEIRSEFVDNPLDLTIEGIGHFKNSVLFAQIKNEEQVSRLTQLADIFRKKFSEIGISGDPRPFKPHMTISKISRSNKLHKMKIRSFPPDIWSGSEDTHFGAQRVKGVQLLCMAGEDKLTGYYRCFAQHDFHDPPDSAKHLPAAK